MIEGSKPSDMPGFIEPQLATLKATAPKGDRWIHEIKFDGYRLQAHVTKGKARIFTRGGHDWTARFARICTALEKLPVERAIFDGELVVERDGRSNFSALQAELKAKRQGELAFYIFDLPYLEGFDLRASPQIERKRVLKGLADEVPFTDPLHFSEHFETDGNELFAQACKLKLEGIISKDVAAPYGSGRNQGWLKVKCVQKGQFKVIGFVPDPAGIAALYLARKEKGGLVYAGKVGTGFTRKISMDVRKRLEPLVTAENRFKLRMPMTRWVMPQPTAEVEYRDITADGMLRHSAFKKLTS